MIPLLLLLAAAIGLAAFARRSFAETLPLTVLAAVLVTYLCTGAGYKSLALPLVGAAALTLVLLAGIKSAKEGGALRWRALAGPALAAFLAAAAAAFFCAGHMRLINFDDVAHWALYTRQQCGLEHFPNVLESASDFADYPPGVQLLAVFLQIGVPFRHAMLFTAQFLWAAACCFLACPPGSQNFIHIRSQPKRSWACCWGIRWSRPGRRASPGCWTPQGSAWPFRCS